MNVDNPSRGGVSRVENRLPFFLVLEDYHHSYTAAMNANPEFASLSYNDSAKRLFSLYIFYGDAYVEAFAENGLHARQVVPMCLPLQSKWALEHGIGTPHSWLYKRPFRWYWTRLLRKSVDEWVLGRVVTEQIKRAKPKVLWVFSGVPVSVHTLRTWRSHAERTVLWWSCPLKPEFPYEGFDLILSGIPALVEHFTMRGLNAAYLPHAFDRRVLNAVRQTRPRIPRVAFVGTMSRDHFDRAGFLDALSRHVALDFYGYGANLLPEDSPLRLNSCAPVWGLDMYSVYEAHLIVLHKNIDIAGTSASAKRLFEATGMGACVVTEAADGLQDLFTPDREIVTYSSLEECVDKIQYLLRNPRIAQEIGLRGQMRTLRDHTYGNRVRHLMRHLEHIGSSVVN